MVRWQGFEWRKLPTGSIEDLGFGWVLGVFFGPRSVSKTHALSPFPVWWSRSPGVACSEVGLVAGEATPSL